MRRRLGAGELKYWEGAGDAGKRREIAGKGIAHKKMEVRVICKWLRRLRK